MRDKVIEIFKSELETADFKAISRQFHKVDINNFENRIRTYDDIKHIIPQYELLNKFTFDIDLGGWNINLFGNKIELKDSPAIFIAKCKIKCTIDAKHLRFPFSFTPIRKRKQYLQMLTGHKFTYRSHKEEYIATLRNKYILVHGEFICLLDSKKYSLLKALYDNKIVELNKEKILERFNQIKK